MALVLVATQTIHLGLIRTHTHTHTKQFNFHKIQEMFRGSKQTFLKLTRVLIDCVQI
jgi:hypothetical protein